MAKIIKINSLVILTVTIAIIVLSHKNLLADDDLNYDVTDDIFALLETDKNNKKADKIAKNYKDKKGKKDKTLQKTTDSHYSTNDATAKNSNETSAPFIKKIRKEIEKLNLIYDKLRVENNIEDEKKRKQISEWKREAEKINAKIELEKAKLEKEIVKTNLEHKRLQEKMSLEELQKNYELLKINKQKEKLQAEIDLKLTQNSEKLTKLKLEKEKIDSELELQKSKFDKSQERDRQEVEKKKMAGDLIDKKSELLTKKAEIKHIEKITELQAKLALMKAENENLAAKLKGSNDKLKIRENHWKEQIDELKNEIKYKDSVQEAENYTKEAKITYLEEPLIAEKTLVISDRRIALNGPIMMSTADYVTDRIHFYNNKDKRYPIFIVIDYSPGGLVFPGLRILKAMENSDAPVYVVVKTFAASMAASIATYAKRSFAYPNAIILHHQLSYGTAGNLTQIKERQEFAEKLWRRLAEKNAEKMEIPFDEFIEKMYAKNSDGDWVEFADNAESINWVTNVVEEIRETRHLKNPDYQKDDHESYYSYMKRRGEDIFTQKIDKNGDPYVNLPRPRAFDFYYLYNKDKYYRIQ